MNDYLSELQLERTEEMIDEQQREDRMNLQLAGVFAIIFTVATVFVLGLWR